MRYIDIDFNNLAPMYTVGRMYEANVVTLNITLPNDFEKNADYYLLEFEMPDRETFNTEPLFITDGKIKFEIPESLTQKGSLNFCVSAYKSIDTELISIEKSELVSLQFTRSIKSDGIITPAIQGFIEKIISLIEAGKIKGDKGDKGEPGEQGPQGLKGEKGEDGKGAVSDWEQMDENADDFIKNRPFYKKSTNYTFPNADYSAPAYAADGMELYRISDQFPKYDDFNGFLVTAHLDGDDSTPEPLEIKTEGSDNNTYQQRDEETGELLIVLIADVFVILYIATPLDQEETIIVPPGVYMQKITGEPTIILNSIECIDELKQIDKKFIPELDYISTEEGDQIRNSAQKAYNQAYAAQTTASQAKTAADNAQTTASQAKTAADNAQTTASQAKTAADNAQTTASQAKTAADNAFKINALRIDDASYMFDGLSTIKKIPIKYVYSNVYRGFLRNCKNLETVFFPGGSKPEDFEQSFYNCNKLKSITGYLDFDKCYSDTKLNMTFKNCISLESINDIKNIRASVSFADCPLDGDTVNKILNALLEGTNPKTLSFNSEITDNLTDEQIAKLPSNWQLG